MTRLHFVKRARKTIKDADIKVGDSYYWWKFRRGGKRVSKVRPHRSQLTQSEYLGAMYAAEDDLGDVVVKFRVEGELSDMMNALETAKGEVETQRDECESKRDNMPDHLQDVGSGELLQQRVEKCDELIGEIENVIGNIDDGDDLTDEKRDEIASEIEAISWDVE